MQTEQNQKGLTMRRMMILAVVLGVVAAGCGGDAGANGGGTDTTQAGDVDNGKTLYDGSCVSCHGADATGIENLGKDLTTSELVIQSSDEELVEFIKVGRPASDPENTTGVDMPPKGGNPSLSDQDILDIVVYLRTLTR